MKHKFTLIELIATIVLVSIVAGGVNYMVIYLSQQTLDLEKAISTTENEQISLLKILKVIEVDNNSVNIIDSANFTTENGNSVSFSDNSIFIDSNLVINDVENFTIAKDITGKKITLILKLNDSPSLTVDTWVE